MKFVVIKDMAAGNEQVGEMWKETKVFDGSTTLEEVAKWAFGWSLTGLAYSRKNVVLTVPHEGEE